MIEGDKPFHGAVIGTLYFGREVTGGQFAGITMILDTLAANPFA